MKKPVIYSATLTWVAFGFVYPSAAAVTGVAVTNRNTPTACYLQVNETEEASNITNISTGIADQLIATVIETCTDPNGYAVTLKGANSGDYTGKFVDNSGGNPRPFTVTYDGIEASPDGELTNNVSAAVNMQKPVKITAAADKAPADASAGIYEETLILTLSTK